MPAKPRARAPQPERRAAGAYGKAIAEAVAAGDFVAALDQALVLWRSYRRAVVADLIDAIAAKCRPATISTAGSRAKDSAHFQTAWVELASSEPEAVMVGALAASLGKRLPVRDVGYLTPNRDLKRQKPFLDRIAALTKLPPDPRVAKALLEIVEKAPFSESGRIYEPVLGLLVELADDRAVPVLQRLLERPVAKGSGIRDYLASALPEAIREIASTPRGALAPADAESVEQLLRELGGGGKPAPHRDVEQLFAECLAKPDDDAPRAVLADALLEREDPRGELIALQLRPALGEVETKRVAALLRKHEKEWLGELHRVTKLRVWRRGFLDEAELQNHAVADDATWARIARDPLLATVRVLHKGKANTEIYRSFVRSPATRALRDVVVPTAEMLQDLIDAGKPLDHVTLEPGLGPSVAPFLGPLAERTGVTRLTFTTQHAPAVLIERLRTLELPPSITELIAEPGRRVYREWDDFVPWLAARDQLGIPRLGVKLSSTRVVAEAGKKRPRLTIHATFDYNLSWVLPRIGPYEHLTIGGVGAATPYTALAEQLAKIKPSMLELRDGWERQLTGPSRAPRARRS